jgi:hypothetical protein
MGAGKLALTAEPIKNCRCKRRELILKQSFDTAEHGWKIALMVENSQKITKHNRVSDQSVNWTLVNPWVRRTRRVFKFILFAFGIMQ